MVINSNIVGAVFRNVAFLREPDVATSRMHPDRHLMSELLRYGKLIRIASAATTSLTFALAATISQSIIGVIALLPA